MGWTYWTMRRFDDRDWGNAWAWSTPPQPLTVIVSEYHKWLHIYERLAEAREWPLVFEG